MDVRKWHSVNAECHSVNVKWHFANGKCHSVNAKWHSVNGKRHFANAIFHKEKRNVPHLRPNDGSF